MENFELRKHIDYVLQRTKELGLSAKTFAGYARHYEIPRYSFHTI